MTDTPDEHQIKARTERQRIFLQRMNQCTEAHVGYGKWLLATLLAINGGSLIAIAQLDERAAQIFALSGHFLIAGMMLAILAGFFVWLNFQFSEHAYAEFVNPNAILDESILPSKYSHSKKITLTLLAAVATGVLSWVFAGVGIYRAGLAF